jgi:hypothetical protein
MNRVDNLIACIRAETAARQAWLASLPGGSCANPPPQALLDAEKATRDALLDLSNPMPRQEKDPQ